MDNKNIEMEKMKYNQFTFEKICKLIEKGKKYREKYKNIEKLCYGENIDVNEWDFVALGFENSDFTPKIEEFYRIGEPTISYGCYNSSYNFAADRPEEGVSVVTTEWLHNFKSVFFGISDDKIAKRGIYKLKGFKLPAVGGDDETLIIPLDWAEKTKIRTLNGLRKAVQEQERKNGN